MKYKIVGGRDVTEEHNRLNQKWASRKMLVKTPAVKVTAEPGGKSKRGLVRIGEQPKTRNEKLKETKKKAENTKQTVNESAYDRMSDRIGNVGKTIWNPIYSGLSSTYTGSLGLVDMAIDAVLPKSMENNFASRWIDKELKYHENKREENKKEVLDIVGNNEITSTAYDLATNLTSMIPDIAMAIASGGGSLMPKLGTTATNLSTKIANTGMKYIKNPQFWNSFTRIAGDTYEERKKEGVEQSKAVAEATLSGVLGSMIELTGGIQKEGFSAAQESAKGIKRLLGFIKDNGLEEGSEEILQNVTGQLLNWAISNQDKKIISNNDDNAVFNPVRELKTGAMGATVGMIMGGGTKLVGDTITRKLPPSTENTVPNATPQTNDITPPSTENIVNGKVENINNRNSATRGNIKVSTNGIANMLENVNTARLSFVEYAKKHFAKSVTNIHTNSKIDISRNGIDKFLSGRLTKEKLASGYEIPRIVETAIKVAESGDMKGKEGILGYEYYENDVIIDDIPYKAYIRVRNTKMGDKYYGHTIGKNLDEIKIEPTAWGSADKSTVHSINAYGSNHNISQNNNIVNSDDMQNNEEYAVERIRNLNKRGARTVEESEELVDLLYNQYGKETKAYPEEVRDDIASPIYGNISTESKTNIVNNLVTNEKYKYQLKKEAEKIKEALQPAPEQYEDIIKIVQGESNPEKFKPSYGLEKFQPLIDAMKRVYEVENRGIKRFKENTRENFNRVIDDFIKDSDNWKDKKTGFQWEINTPQRNAYDALGKDADRFIDLFINPMLKNDVQKIRYIAEKKQKIIDLKLTPEEFEQTMKYGEGVIDDVPDRIKNAAQVFNEVAEQIKNDVNATLVLNGYKPIDNPKINLNSNEFKKVISVLSGEKTIDQILKPKIEPDKLNELKEILDNPPKDMTVKERKQIKKQIEEIENVFFGDNKIKGTVDTKKIDEENAKNQKYNERIRQFVNIAKRYGIDSIDYNSRGQISASINIPYFPHGENLDSMQKFKRAMGFSFDVLELPGEIAGRTEQFKPNKKYVSNIDEKRRGQITSYDLNNWDRYITEVSEVIYHTSDITKLRLLENSLRNKYSMSQIDEDTKIARSMMNAAELSEYFDGLGDRKNELTAHNHLINWLNEYANIIAGKKHSLDRGMEKLLNRKIYNAMTNAEINWAINQVGGNVSSVINQFSQGTSLVAEKDIRDIASAVNTLLFGDKTTLDESDFMTMRNGTIRLTKRGVDKITDIMFKLPTTAEGITSKLVWQTAYNEAIRKGKTETQAQTDADNYARSVMADRTKIGRPTIFASKNVGVKFLATFQIEPANTFFHYIKDLSREAKGRGILWLIKTYVATAFLNHLFNRGKEELTGYGNVMLDPVDTIHTVYKYIADEEGIELADVWKSVGENMGNVPFMQTPMALAGFDDIGQVPMSGMIPNLPEMYRKYKDKDYKDLIWDIGDVVISPMNSIGGYAQTKKTFKGLSAVIKGDERYPIAKTPGNYIKGALFGKNALDETREYWNKKDKLNRAKKMYEENPSNVNAINYEQRSVEASYQEEMLNAIQNLPKDKQAAGERLLLLSLKDKDVFYDKRDVVIKKVHDSDMTDDYIVASMPSSTIKWTDDSEEREYTMSPTEYASFSAEYLRTVKNNRKNFAISNVYDRLDSEERKEVFAELKNYAEASAKNRLGGYSMSDTDKKIQEAERKGIDPHIYISAKISARDVESDKDSNGNTIRYSRDIKRMKAIKNNIKGLTQKQYKDLCRILGYNENAINQFFMVP